MLFDPETRRRLEALRLELRRSFASGAAGEAERAPGLGGRDRFREHRAYVEGDDPRSIDWNLYGRLGELHTKVFERDTDLDVEVLLDRSASMALGTPTKDDFTRRVAAGITFGLAGPGRPVGLRGLAPGAPALGTPAADERGARAGLERLEELPPPAGDGALEGLRERLGRGARARLVFVLSDLLGPAADVTAWPSVSSPLAAVVIGAVDAPEDRDPRPGERLLLQDAETGDRVEIAVDEALLTRYREAFRARREDQAREARRRGFAFVELEVGLGFEAAVRRLISAAGARR